MQFLELMGEAKAAGHKHPLKWAIQEAVRHNILRDYLERKGGEVLSILMTEYDYATCTPPPCFLHNKRICSELTFLAFPAVSSVRNEQIRLYDPIHELRPTKKHPEPCHRGFRTMLRGLA